NIHRRTANSRQLWVREKEDFVLLYRATYRTAKAIARIDWFGSAVGIVREIVCRQRRPSSHFIRGAVVVVGAGLCRNIDDTCICSAVLCREVVRQDAELLHCIQWYLLPNSGYNLVIISCAVEKSVRARGTRAVD